MFGMVAKIPLTLGNATVQAYLTWLDQHPVLTRALVLGKEIRKIINTRGWKSKATVNLSARHFTEALASIAYKGGLNQTYVHSQTRVSLDEVILDLDFAGAYTAAMAVLPVIDWPEPAAVVQDPAEIAETYRQGICGDQGAVVSITFVECTFSFPPDCPYPCLPIQAEYGYGLVYPLNGTTTCTGIEVALALAMGAQITIKHGMRFPGFQDTTGVPQLAFAGFLGELTRRRAQEPEDSLSNRLLKEMTNSFSGKLAQGITEREVYNFSGESQPLLASSVTVLCGNDHRHSQGCTGRPCCENRHTSSLQGTLSDYRWSHGSRPTSVCFRGGPQRPCGSASILCSSLPGHLRGTDAEYTDPSP
jgi:hypothetical protein